MIVNIKKIIINLKHILVFSFILLVYLYGGNENYTITYKIPMFIFMIIQSIEIMKNKKIKINPNIVVMFIFSFYCLISNFWAINPTSSITMGKTLLLLSIFVLVLYNFYIDIDNGFDKLLKVVMYAGICFCVYVVAYYGIANFFEFLLNGKRIGAEIDNVNRIGLEACVTFLIILFYSINKSKYNILFLPLTFLVALGTGSRKVVIFLILGTISLLIFKNDNNKYLGILKKITTIIIVFIGIKLFLDTFSSSSIINRFSLFLNSFTGNGEIDHSTLERKAFIEYGMKQFYETPFLGIGIANSGYITMKAAGYSTYLHNNFVELLSTAGIIGFLIYYFNYFYLLRETIKLKINKNYKMFMIVFLLIMLILDYGLVSYSAKNTYIYMLISILGIHCIKEE